MYMKILVNGFVSSKLSTGCSLLFAQFKFSLQITLCFLHRGSLFCRWREQLVYYWSSCSRLLLSTITFSVCCATFHIQGVCVLLLLHLDILYGSTEAFSNVMQSSQNTCVYLLLMFVVHEGAWRCRGEICKRSNYWIW